MRKQRDTGAIPVVNYPAAHRGLGSWSYVKYSYGNTVGLEVFVFPKLTLLLVGWLRNRREARQSLST